ncbi:MAG: TIGR00730 family Rossman fold protein [Fuerstiella sp.]|jgi:cytokinin riboside 5'-monophosphate phosphoribohydrolase
MAAICVFCGAYDGGSHYLNAAARLGEFIAASRHSLVYGGGSVGMMGAVADSCLKHGGNVVGVIPEALATVELMHPLVDDMRVVPDMHVRKATMHELSDAYIALPGGFGTMEELFEALCWAQLGFHKASVAVLNLDGFYDGLVQMADRMVATGFLQQSARDLMEVVHDVDQLEQWLNVKLN